MFEIDHERLAELLYSTAPESRRQLDWEEWAVFEPSGNMVRKIYRDQASAIISDFIRPLLAAPATEEPTE